MFGLVEESRVLALKELSDINAIPAPRISAFPYLAMPVDGDIKLPSTSSADETLQRLRHLKRYGADGIKFMGAPEEILWAALGEADKL